MEFLINLAYVILYSYFIGCFCSAFYLVKFYNKQDIREINSGTVGARNAGRILGKKGFIIVFLADFLKTILALAITIKFFESEPNFSILFSASILSVMIGHTFPAQLDFKGGKGVVPFTASIFVINFWVLLVSLIVLFLTLLITRNQKISITAAVLTTIPSSLFFFGYYPIFLNQATILAILFSIILIFFSHLKKSKNVNI